MRGKLIKEECYATTIEIRIHRVAEQNEKINRFISLVSIFRAD